MRALLFALAQLPAGPPQTGGYMKAGYIAIAAIVGFYGLYLWSRHVAARRKDRGR